MRRHSAHLHPRHAALLIIDMQNDYCHERGKIALNRVDVSDAQRIVPVIERLAARARKVGVPVVFVRTTHSPRTSSEVWELRTERHIGKPDVAEEGTWGAEFYKLAPQPEDLIIEKHRYGAFSNTKLDDTLRKLHRKALILTGVATNVCVESTAREGFGREYHITLVRDACGAYSKELAEGTFLNIERSFGRVLAADEVIRSWELLADEPR